MLALVVTLVLGGASVARALEGPKVDALTDLRFSLDGSNWTDDPGKVPDVLGDWGCDEGSPWPGVGTGGAITGSPEGVDPCAMSPDEFVSRTYYVKNVSSHTGLYEVGIGEFTLSDNAEFAVGSQIKGVTTSGISVEDSGEFLMNGVDTGGHTLTPAAYSQLAAIRLAPEAVVRVVDTVSIPEDATWEPDQSFSPSMWVGFSGVVEVDTDKDGLPDTVEGEIGTNPLNPFNPLPSGTVGQQYRPQPFLPTVPEGATVVVDQSTLPPGITLENGELSGRPSRSGVYDIDFTITLPDGAEYTSIRRLVVHPAGGLWPIVVGGIVGVIVGIIGPGLGAALGSVGGVAGGSVGGIIGSVDGLGAGGGLGSVLGSAEGSVGGSMSGSLAGSVGAVVGGWVSGAVGTVTGALGSNDGGSDGSTSGTTGGPTGGTTGGTTGGDGTAVDGSGPHDAAVPVATGQIPVEQITPRETSPSDEWARANSEVRSSLPTTGVGAIDLLLWALTAAAAGATLILFAKRRRPRSAED